MIRQTNYFVRELLHIQAEYSITSSDSFSYGGQRSYLHLAKRFDSWLPFITYGFVIDDFDYELELPTRETEEENLIAYEVLRDFNRFATSQKNNDSSITVGIRWDFASQQAAKFQCDRFFFEKNSSSLHGRVDNIYDKNEVKTWCSVSYDWVF